MHWTARTAAIAVIASLLFASSGARQDLYPEDDTTAVPQAEPAEIPSLGTDPTLQENATSSPAGELYELHPAVERYIKRQTARTERLLKPFTDLDATPESSIFVRAQQSCAGPIRRVRDYCFCMMHLQELGPLAALVQTRVPQHAPHTLGVCLPSDFPTTIASLKAEQVVVNLNARDDAGEIERLSNYRVSPDGKKIAYAFRRLNGHVAVVLKDVDSEQAGELLTAQGCQPLAWTSDSKHLLYIERDSVNSDARCSNVMMRTFPNQAKIVFSDPESSFVLHSTQSYTFLEQKTSKSSALLVLVSEDGDVVQKYIYQAARRVQLSPREISGGVLFMEDQPHSAIRARFVAPSAMRDFVTNGEMVLNPSELQNVPLPAGASLMHSTCSDGCCVQWERNGLRNRFAVQKLEGSSSSQRLSAPRYVDINVPTYDQIVTGYSLSDGEHAILTYATLLRPMNVYSLDCATNSLVLERQEMFPSFDASPYAEDVEFIPTVKGRQAEITFYFKKDKVQLNGQSPMLLAINNGATLFSASFMRARLVALMEQGLIVAIGYTGKWEDLPYRSLPELVKKQKAVANDLIAIVDFAVRNSFTSHDRLSLLGAFETSAPVAAFINRKPRLCKSAIFLEAAVDSVETLNTSAHYLDADKATPANLEAARAFSPVDHIPLNPPYFPDVVIIDLHHPGSRQSTISARYHASLLDATRVRTTTLLYIGFPSSEDEYSPMKILSAFLLKTVAELDCTGQPSSPQPEVDPGHYSD